MRRLIFIIFIPAMINSCDLVDSHNSKPMDQIFYEINVVNVDGSGHHIISEGWNSNINYEKNKILFINNSALYSVNFDGSELKEIFNNNLIWDYSISRDGDKIVLSVYENSSSNLFIMNSDGTGRVRLTDAQNSFTSEPHFSFDSDYIVFRRDWDICRINSSGGGFELIQSHPDSSAVFRDPYFLSDNSRIVYFEENITYFSDSTSMHLFDLNSNTDSVLMILRDNTFYNPYLDVAPEERALFFQGYGLGVDSLKTMDFNNNTIRNIDRAFFGSFSFQGDEIIYSDLNTIYLVDSDGNKRIIYEEKDENRSIKKPKLSFDKQTVVFESEHFVPAE